MLPHTAKNPGAAHVSGAAAATSRTPESYENSPTELHCNGFTYSESAQRFISNRQLTVFRHAADTGRQRHTQ